MSRVTIMYHLPVLVINIHSVGVINDRITLAHFRLIDLQERFTAADLLSKP